MAHPLAHTLQPQPQLSRGYGQPLPGTHPHLLAPGELTAGIPRDEYEQRRRALMDGLEDGSVVVVAGGRLKYLSGKIFYKFRQASNFWYLTGWEEPDSVLVLEKTSAAKGYKMTMFCPSKDPHDEMWHGPRSGREGAVEVFGADEAFDITHLAPRLKTILTAPSSSSASHPIYIDVPGVAPTSRIRLRTPPSKPKSFLDYLVPGRADSDELAAIFSGEKSNRPIRSASVEVEKLRLIKSPNEIKLMRRAADVSSAAHAKVMRFCEPTATSSLTESSLVAHFTYHTSLAGSPRLAYVPVCASGSSGLTIHYTKNLLPLHAGDVVLLDAGCELAGYASDITRTFPVSGTFSSPQRDLYEAVLRVEKACIAVCTADRALSLDGLHDMSCRLMKAELKDLGFNLRGTEMERILYPHFVGHPVGIDLHDTPSFGRNEPIQEGMVITIEPGLSVPPHNNFPKAFHNLAVRVEDEILVRKDDYVILSVDAPKEVVDIEACCQGLLERH
ncbi:hypothetical protein RQP46_007531 [Phenoliferia psychrophenolica]